MCLIFKMASVVLINQELASKEMNGVFGQSKALISEGNGVLGQSEAGIHSFEPIRSRYLKIREFWGYYYWKFRKMLDPANALVG